MCRDPAERESMWVGASSPRSDKSTWLLSALLPMHSDCCSTAAAQPAGSPRWRQATSLAEQAQANRCLQGGALTRCPSQPVTWSEV